MCPAGNGLQRPSRPDNFPAEGIKQRQYENSWTVFDENTGITKIVRWLLNGLRIQTGD